MEVGLHFRHGSARGLIGLALTLIAGILQPGCSRDAGSAKGAEAVVQERDTEVTHEECDVASGGAEHLDANGDGRADVSLVREGARETCRAVDLNFDGLIDVWSYFDPQGRVRRRESDYDRDGRVDEISIFKDGVRVENRRATTLSHRLDTWEYFQGGKLVRTERDSDGDRVVDQWWEYPKPGCPVIHADVNRDGHPEPTASVDYCKDTGYVPPERQDYRTPESPSFEQTGVLPTEVDSKLEGDDQKPASGGTGGTP